MDGERIRAIEAVIQTPQAVTTYRRLGQGPALLLLCDPAGGWALVETLAAAGFRVYAPVAALTPGGVACGPASPPTDLAAWLAGVIDGLALDRPTLLATGGFARPVLRFAALERERIGRAVIVSGDERTAALAARLARDGAPALCVPVAAAAAGRLAELLRGETVDTAAGAARNSLR